MKDLYKYLQEHIPKSFVEEQNLWNSSIPLLYMPSELKLIELITDYQKSHPYIVYRIISREFDFYELPVKIKCDILCSVINKYSIKQIDDVNFFEDIILLPIKDLSQEIYVNCCFHYIKLLKDVCLKRIQLDYIWALWDFLHWILYKHDELTKVAYVISLTFVELAAKYSNWFKEYVDERHFEELEKMIVICKGNKDFIFNTLYWLISIKTERKRSFIEKIYILADEAIERLQIVNQLSKDKINAMITLIDIKEG